MKILQTDRIYEALKGAIISGALKQGEHLKESVLVSNFNASRTPVREALRMLESARLIERKPNRGVVVKEISLSGAREIIYVRAVLDAAAAELLIANGSNQALHEIRSALSEARDCLRIGDMRGCMSANDAFHSLIGKYAGNEVLFTLLQGTQEMSSIVNHASIQVPGRIEKALQEHGKILEALEHHDIVETREAIMTHYAHVKETIPSALDLIRRREETDLARYLSQWTDNA